MASKQQEALGERINQESRALSMQLAEQKRLNSEAIKAKLLGKLSEEDSAAFKESLSEKISGIEAALSTLESERRTLEEISQQSRLAKIDFIATWRNATIEGKVELQKTLFPPRFVLESRKWLSKPQEQAVNGGFSSVV